MDLFYQLIFTSNNFKNLDPTGLICGQNVILNTPTGSGKSTVFELSVYILRKLKNIPDGVGICLEPLNNILSEKTNVESKFQSAYLTMTGEDIRKGLAKLSISEHEMLSEKFMYLYGHPESFFSTKGGYVLYLLVTVLCQISII